MHKKSVSLFSDFSKTLHTRAALRWRFISREGSVRSRYSGVDKFASDTIRSCAPFDGCSPSDRPTPAGVSDVTRVEECSSGDETEASPRWRLFHNRSHKLVPTYPLYVVVPGAMTDAEIR